MSTELVIFVGALVLGYLLVCLADPWVDCMWCKGSPKRRGNGSALAVAGLVGAAMGAAWMGIPAGPVFVFVVVTWAGVALFGGRRSYHFCSVPGWLGGCEGKGRRRRIGSKLLGMGLGAIE